MIPSPKGHFLFGNALDFKPQEFHKAIRKWTFEHGELYKFRLLHKNFYVVSNPSVILKMMKERPGKYRRSSKISSILNEVGGFGLFTAEGKAWTRQKRLMTSSFSKKNIKNYYPKLVEISKRLNGVINSGQEVVDARRLFTSFTVDVTTSFSFGLDANSMLNNNVQVINDLKFIFEMVGRRVSRPFPVWRYLKGKDDKRLIESVNRVKDYVAGYIDKAYERVAKDGEAHNILEAMIVAGEDEGDAFTKEELFGNVITLLLAGEDTTANTLCWCIYYLSQHQEVLEELRASMAHLSDDVTIEQLDELDFLQSVIDESLRLRPVAPFLMFESENDEEILGHKIPKGSPIMTHFSFSHFDEKYFDSPMKFNPKRWKNMKSDSLNEIFMPFGAGARICIGKALAILEMKLALIEIIKNYDFSLACPASEIDDIFNFTLNPNKMPIKFKALK